MLNICTIRFVLLLAFLCSELSGIELETTHIRELSPHIPTSEDQFTLHADFEANTEEANTIPLYLINRSSKTITLFADSGFFFTFLETQNESDEWVRAQPYQFSSCGVSYDYSVTITPNHYHKTHGLQYTEGQHRPVRYSIYLNEVNTSSNTSESLISLEGLAIASYDELTLKYSKDFELVSALARNELPIDLDPHLQDGLQAMAIKKLGDEAFPPFKSKETLQKVIEDFPDYKELAQRSLNKVNNRLLKN